MQAIQIALARAIYGIRFPRTSATISKEITVGRRILVISPHPDDEIIGAGGTLLSVRGRSSIVLVYCSDGEFSDVTLDPNEMKTIRRQEAEEVAVELKAKGYYLGWPERRFRHALDEAKADLRQILLSESPDVIFVPFFMDYHIDHIMTNLIVREVLCEIASLRGATMISYSVRVPLVARELANMVVDITRELPAKRTLLYDSYKSQGFCISLSWLI